MSGCTADVKERLESLVENCQLLLMQIKSGTVHHHGPHLSGEEVHLRIVTSSQVLSDTCTKMSVLFSRPPCPSVQDCGTLCTKIEHCILSLVSAYSQLEPSQGAALKQEIQKAVRRMIHGVECLGSITMKAGCAIDSRARLQGTGSLWEQCDMVSKLPTDNKKATLKICLTELKLLKDACEEVDKLVECGGVSEDISEQFEVLTQSKLKISSLVEPVAEEPSEHEVKKDDEDEEKWNEEDMLRILPCVNLIKLCTTVTEETCRAIVKYGDISQENLIADLDLASGCIQGLSPLVDELASILDAPVDHHQLALHGSNLLRQLKCTLDVVSGSHFCKMGDDTWKRGDWNRQLDEFKAAVVDQVTSA